MDNSSDVGRLVLRLTLGILVLLHGIAKLVGGPDYIVGLVTKSGLPGPLGYLVYVGEVLAPLLIIIGLWTRPAALVIVINMIVAVGLVHMGQLSSTGGWALELQACFLFMGLAIALLGAGRYSVAGRGGRFN